METNTDVDAERENSTCSSSDAIHHTIQFLCQTISSSATSATSADKSTATTNAQEQDVEQTLPQSFFCPLTMNVMVEPVIDYEGNTYEREAITTWLEDHDTSPVTRNPLGINHLIPNRAIRDAICDKMGQEWTKKAERTLMKRPPASSSRRVRESPTNLTNRSRVNSFLRELSIMAGKCLSLNDRGVCAFAYGKLTVVLEVPESVGSFILYTSIGAIAPTPNEEETRHRRNLVYKRVLELNYLQQETKGGCLSVDPMNSQIVFSYIDRVSEINDFEFQNIVENFIDTSLNLKRWIQTILSGRQSV